MSDIPTWDPATSRFIFDVAARSRTTVTVAFEGGERMRTVVTQTVPAVIQQAAWVSCPGPPTDLSSGKSFAVMEQTFLSSLEVKPFHSDGVQCGPPGLAVLRFNAAAKVDEEIMAGLISNAHTLTTPGGDSIHVIVVIRFEGGGGGAAPTAAAQTATIAARLGLDLTRKPHRVGPPVDAGGGHAVPID
jgi:hypothetical protein